MTTLARPDRPRPDHLLSAAEYDALTRCRTEMLAIAWALSQPVLSPSAHLEMIGRNVERALGGGR